MRSFKVGSSLAWYTRAVVLTVGLLASLSGLRAQVVLWTWSTGDLLLIVNPPILSFGVTLDIVGTDPKDFNGLTILNQGTINWSGGPLRSGNGGSLTNAAGAFFNDQNTVAAAISNVFGGSFSFANAGTYTKSGNALTTISVPFNNTGSVSINAGEFRLQGGGSISGAGTLTTAPGATTSFNADYSIGDGSSLGGSGIYQLLNGTLLIDGTIGVTSFNQSNGTLAGTHTFDDSTINWSNGDWNSTGTSTLNGGTILNLTSANPKDFNGRAIINEGTVNWSGGGPLRSGNSGSLTNASGAFLNDQNTVDATVSNVFGGSFSFSNAGTYTKSGNALTTITVPFNNTGSVLVNAGEFRLQGGGSISGAGTLTTAPGAITSFNADYTIGDGSSLGGSGIYHLLNGTLLIDGTIGVTSFNQSNGTLAGTHTFDDSTINWSNGDWNSTGTSTLNSGTILNLTSANPKDFNGRAIINEGTINWSGGGPLRSGSSGSLTNAVGAFLNDQNTVAAAVSNVFGGSFSFSNAGTYTKSGNALTTITVPFNNTGSVLVNAGEFRLQGGGSISGAGTLSTAPGATTSFNASYTVANAASLLGSGLYELLAGTLILDGTFSAPVFDQTGGILAGTHTFDDSTFNWSGGTWNSTGTSTLNSGTILNLTSANPKDFNGRAVINQGTINWSGGGPLRSGSSGSLTNAAGAFFNDQNTVAAAVSNVFGGSFSFTNAGTYTKSGSALTTISVPFSNSGSIVVTSGTLSFSSTYTNPNGSLELQNNASLTLPAGFVLHLGSGLGSLSGHGIVSVPAGVVVEGMFEPINLSLTGDLTLQSTALLSFTLSGTTRGTDYDRLDVTGNASLGGSLQVFFDSGSGFQDIVSPTDTFILVDASGTLSGAFANIASGDLLVTADGLGLFKVNYGAGSPFDISSVVLSDFQAVPEPSTWALMILGLAILGVTARRRSRRTR